MSHCAAEPHPGGGEFAGLAGCVHPEGPGAVELVVHGFALLPQSFERLYTGFCQAVRLWVVYTASSVCYTVVLEELAEFSGGEDPFSITG